MSPRITFLNSGAKFFIHYTKRPSALITYLDLIVFKAVSRSTILFLAVIFVSFATLVRSARDISSFMLASERAWLVATPDIGASLSGNSVYV
jgi:hypothetical protein